MPNNFWHLSAKETLILIADHQSGNFDFRDFPEAQDPEWPFIHLTGGLWEVFASLREKGRKAVEEILSHTVIVNRILAFLRTGDYHTAKAITEHIWFPYAEKHIQAILDLQIQENQIQSMPGPDCAYVYTISTQPK